MIVSSKKVRHGALCPHPAQDRWFMAAIIYQEGIDKKRKKCGISIE
ncbi:hypothetical protein [Pseudomonas sp. RL_35y_Pfl2_P42]